jgi:hypothetical protein
MEEAVPPLLRGQDQFRSVRGDKATPLQKQTARQSQQPSDRPPNEFPCNPMNLGTIIPRSH